MTRRVWVLLVVLLAIVVVKLAATTYDWLAHADDRERLVAMRGRLVDAGVEVLRTRMRLDTLRKDIEREDGELARERRALDAYGRGAEGGALPSHLYAAYRADLDRYNEHVERRNVRFREWRKVIQRNHASVDRYNALMDSVRAAARELGDPYYPVPSPLEAAEERGILRPAPEPEGP